MKPPHALGWICIARGARYHHRATIAPGGGLLCVVTWWDGMQEALSRAKFRPANPIGHTYRDMPCEVISWAPKLVHLRTVAGEERWVLREQVTPIDSTCK